MRFEETEIVELKGIVTDDIKKEIIAFANATAELCILVSKMTGMLSV